MIVDAIAESINNSHVIDPVEDVVVNPALFLETKNRVTCGCFGILIATQLSKSPINTLEEIQSFLQERVGDSVLSKSVNHLNSVENTVLSRFSKNIQTFSIKQEYLPDIYENVLAYDFKPHNGAITVTKSSLRNKKHGSFFTPRAFSLNLVRVTLDHYIEKKLGIISFSSNLNSKEKGKSEVKALFLQSRFVDFSCGVGSFLLSVLDYYQQFVDKVVDSNLAKNLFGVDSDAIAIEIAKYQICSELQRIELFTTLSCNFECGNPLIPKSDDSLNRERLLFQGFIYTACLGIDIAELSSKFDIIVGNPPWEKVRFEDKEFFSIFYPKIARIYKKDERSNEINQLAERYPILYSYYQTYRRELDSFVHSKVLCKMFPLSSSGEVNTYALFTELALNFQDENGFIGLLVKSSLLTSKVNERIFKHLLNNGKIALIADYVNNKKIFDIDSRERFSFILVGGNYQKFELAMCLKNIDDVISSKYVSLSKAELELINPDTSLIPNTSHSANLRILKEVITQNSMFKDVYNKARFGRIVHFTLHAQYISKQANDSNLPVYEGKFFHQYDSKYSDFSCLTIEQKYANKSSSRIIEESLKKSREYELQARYFIDKDKWQELTKNYRKKYSLMWRSLTSATNSRTCIATLMPHTPSSQSVQLLQLENDDDLILLCAVFNSFIFDFIVRQKLNGVDLTKTIINQMPVPPSDRYDNRVFLNNQLSIREHIILRVGYLYSNDKRLDDLFSKYEIQKHHDRAEVIAEIDVLIALAYNMRLDTFIEIINSFKTIPNERKILLRELASKFLSN